MKTVWRTLGFLALILCGCTDKQAESDHLVIKELRKLESNTNTGLNYTQYSDRLLTTTAEVDVLLKDHPDPAFAARVRHIETCYRTARDAWDENIHGDVTDQHALQKYWKEASEKLDQLDAYAVASAGKRKDLDEEDQRATELQRTEDRRIADANLHEWDQEREHRKREDERHKEDDQAEQARQDQAEQAAAQKRHADEIAAARAEHDRRFAPEGTLFLIRNVTARIKGGLAGITPGTEVTVLRKNPDGTLHVKEKPGTLEADIQPAWATNDRDRAASAKRVDEDEQAQASDGVSQMQTDAAQRRRDEQIRAGQAMDDAANQSQRSQVQLGTNPLDGNGY